ncbi:hypothetical protein L209DRAFT_733082 [Thermothelomyces heterothallicus CBS 203.75]
MATEVAFAKTFLSLLDSKPSKISPDHIEDPRNYPGSSPYILPRVRSQKPFSKPRPSTTSGANAGTTTSSSAAALGASTTTGSSSSSSTVDVTLRSPRNPPFEISLPATPPATSLAELKERLADETSIPLDKIKLLHNKKPVADTKLLRDLVTPAKEGAESQEGGGALELGVMILAGGAGFFKPKEKPAAAPEEEKRDDKVMEADKQDKDVDMADAAATAPVAQGLSGKAVLETDQFWADLKGYLQHRVRDDEVAREAAELFKKAWEGR